MAEIQVQQASVMRSFENADLVGEFSPLRPVGQKHFFRVLDVLKTGKTLETEIEVLGLTSEDPPNAQALLDGYRVVGKAVISTSLSKHWEATIELMQANTNDRFLNMQIFAGLLRCIRKICMERFIGHLAIVDIGDISQNWYRDFFRLAGFSRCYCHASNGNTLRLENFNCLASRKSPLEDFSTVYEKVEVWLAEGRCTKALLDSVASGEAAEVERRYFRDLLAEIREEKQGQMGRAQIERTVRGQMRSQRAWQETVRTSKAPSKKTVKPGSEILSSSKHCSSQEKVVKSMGGSALRATKKQKRSRKAQKEGFWRARYLRTPQVWQF